MDGELSGERAAENQSLYRSINESVHDLNQTFGEVTITPFSGEWICECADTHCMLRINATLQEYETVRANGRTFLVVPGHVYPEVGDYRRERPLRDRREAQRRRRDRREPRPAAHGRRLIRRYVGPLGRLCRGEQLAPLLAQTDLRSRQRGRRPSTSSQNAREWLGTRRWQSSWTTT